MLQFYYDFLDRFLLKGSWAPLFMDTGELPRATRLPATTRLFCFSDSLYLALSAGSLDELVVPSEREAYLECKHRYMVTNAGQRREGGLMKLENKGSGCIALAPKVRAVWCGRRQNLLFLLDPHRIRRKSA
jgi:hypothetical protein